MNGSVSASHVVDGGAELVSQSDPEESTIQAIVRSVAAVKGAPSTELDPLYDYVDVDALEDLIRHLASISAT